MMILLFSGSAGASTRGRDSKLGPEFLQIESILYCKVNSYLERKTSSQDHSNWPLRTDLYAAEGDGASFINLTSTHFGFWQFIVDNDQINLHSTELTSHTEKLFRTLDLVGKFENGEKRQYHLDAWTQSNLAKNVQRRKNDF